jgi:hypothetical protein
MKPSSWQNPLEKSLANCDKYQYTPLDPKPNSIRLLRLFHAPDPSYPIRCSLFNTTLSSAPPYIALSYSWGDKSGSQPIIVYSKTLSVTPNLKHALKRLRPKSGEPELVLWVDAICINQEDIPERNIQTANMRAIYQHASSVTVWLGSESNKSKGAMQISRDLNACSSPEAVKELVQDPQRIGQLEALVVLFRRQYWWRIWVIQEVSAASSAVVYCGEETISWTALDKVCDILKGELDYLHSLFYKSPSYVRTLTFGGPRGLQLSRYSPGVSAPPLLELLLSHKSKKSTDPKDKVYALVGISSSRHTFGLIDYSRSLRDIYTHTARHIITTSKKLDVICVKQHDINSEDFPSWAPDWTRPGRWGPHSGGPIIGLHHREPQFTASGTTLADVQFLKDGYVLRTKGIHIDTIATLGMPFKKRGPPSDVAPLLEVFHDWWNLFVSTTNSGSLSAQKSFAKAISCGNWEFQDEEIYSSKLENIFALSDEVLSNSDILRLDPPSRSSTNLSNSTASLLDDEETTDEPEKAQFSTILSAGLTMNRRRMFISKEKTVGLAPWDAEQGDIICVLLGCRFPVVLRPRGPSDNYYVLVGEAYIEGFMDGEAIVGLEEGYFSLNTFEIH